MITVKNIGGDAHVMNADVERNVSIRIYGTYTKHYDKIFKVGDMAVYDSYNLVYTGEILSITDKSVTISQKSVGTTRNKRLKLYEFTRRNYDYNSDRIAKENSDTMMVI
jgi:hypothetical protein